MCIIQISYKLSARYFVVISSSVKLSRNEYLSFSPWNPLEILRRKREGGYERRCKGAANSRV